MPDEAQPIQATEEDDLTRFRRLLRSRTDTPGRQVLDASDRLYAALARAAGATLPQEQLVALTQALTHACEIQVLTFQDAAALLERAGRELAPFRGAVERFVTAAEGYGPLVQELRAHVQDLLTASREASAEIGQEIALAAATVLRDASAKQGRQAARWLWVGVLLVLLTAASAFHAWRAHDLIYRATRTPTMNAAPAP